MPPQNACQEFVNFFLQENDIEKALDAVELSFRFHRRTSERAAICKPS